MKKKLNLPIPIERKFCLSCGYPLMPIWVEGKLFGWVCHACGNAMYEEDESAK